MTIIAVVIGFLYCFSLLLIFLFSLSQLHLTWYYLYRKKKNTVVKLPDVLPFVTVQLPLYNEKYVIERLLKAAVSLDYPSDRLEIQILDDSDDDSAELVQHEIESYKAEGVDIVYLKREKREGFKAGALAHGLGKAKGEFIAIFDADFIPSPDFLTKAIAHFGDDRTGMVQTRWAHLNRDYSILTRLQAFGLDAHFTVEQTGRSNAGSFINFNGTGGIWRKKCITDAGGWSADTLTEDLDLSYRAQLKGWNFKFLEGQEAPAELPVLMSAIKSQQYRWNKGAAETAKKHLSHILRSDLSLQVKFHAFCHLLNSSVFIVIFLAAILSVPMLFISEIYPSFETIFQLGSIFLLGFFSIAIFYWTASKSLYPDKTITYYYSLFPSFLIISMGLSLHNTIAVLQGLSGKKSAFIRTPKFNIINKKDSWRGKQYVDVKLNFFTAMEGFLSLYFIFGIVAGIILNNWTLMIFHVMLALGFALVFLYSLKALRNA